MMMAAALALSELSPAVKTGEGRLLPQLSDIRKVSQHIANAVVLQAIKEGFANPIDAKELPNRIESTMWQPNY
jgi:malate dehydrogenase (oxaloacetate-decarboxylating)